jgi:2-polyprenyl-3-methyl-5-hydroxy-6-metoxy-1,4-benzoquinol methylase
MKARQVIENYEKQLQETRLYWDNLAPAFDDEPDHGLRNSLTLETWTQLLKTLLPQKTATILDIGCGTGSLSVVLAKFGHQVTGIDLSPAMLALAQTKADAQGLQVEFQVMDAAFPQLTAQSFNVLICRHLLWALPQPKQVLQRWVKFLKQRGRLVLIEGYWSTGAGLRSNEITEMLPSSMTHISVQNLSDKPDLWGGYVTDERYVISADLMK